MCLKVDVLNKTAIGVISALVAILILVTLGVMILFYLKRLSPVIKRAQFGTIFSLFQYSKNMGL